MCTIAFLLVVTLITNQINCTLFKPLKEVLPFVPVLFEGFDIIECCDWDLIHKSLKDKDVNTRNKILREYIQKFQDVDILIGLHGAGLTNILYMKPSSILIEFSNWIIALLI